MDPYHVMTRQYDNDVGRGLNYMGYIFEVIMHHLAITPSAKAPPHYIYIPSLEEQWVEHRGGIGTSGVGGEDDD